MIEKICLSQLKADIHRVNGSRVRIIQWIFVHCRVVWKKAGRIMSASKIWNSIILAFFLVMLFWSVLRTDSPAHFPMWITQITIWNVEIDYRHWVSTLHIDIGFGALIINIRKCIMILVLRTVFGFPIIFSSNCFLETNWK